MKKSNVYICNPGTGIFKIGKADDVLKRFSDLRIPSCKFCCSSEEYWSIECPEDDVYSLEKTLHYLFRDQRTRGYGVSGCTEWFMSRIYGVCMSYVTNICLLKGYHLQRLSSNWSYDDDLNKRVELAESALLERGMNLLAGCYFDSKFGHVARGDEIIYGVPREEFNVFKETIDYIDSYRDDAGWQRNINAKKIDLMLGSAEKTRDQQYSGLDADEEAA